MVRPEKAKAVAEVEEKLKEAEGVILTEFSGLTVKEFQGLREGLGKTVEYKIFKNTMVRLAAGNQGYSDLEPFLEGSTGLVFCYEDPVGVLKKLKKFAEDLKPLKIKAGILDNAVVDAAYAKQLADLPSREELLAMLVGTVQSPLSKLVGVLESPIAALARTLEAIAKEKEAGQPAG